MPFDLLKIPARDEKQQFFLSATFFEHKDARILGWANARAAERLVDELSKDQR